MAHTTTKLMSETICQDLNIPTGHLGMDERVVVTTWCKTYGRLLTTCRSTSPLFHIPLAPTYEFVRALITALLSSREPVFCLKNLLWALLGPFFSCLPLGLWLPVS